MRRKGSKLKSGADESRRNDPDRREGHTIAYICSGRNLYGGEISLLEAATVIHKRSNLLFLLPKPGSFQSALEAHGMRVINYTPPNGSDQSASAFDVFLRDTILQNRVDVLHMNKAFAGRRGVARIARTVTREAGIPMVAHVRGYHSKIDRRHKALLAEMDKIICVSHSTRRQLLKGDTPKELLEREADIEVVYNGRGLERYMFSSRKRTAIRRRLGIPEETLIVGLVARFDPSKGQHRFIELARRFAGNHEIHWIMAGEVSRARNEAYGRRIREAIDQARLDAQFTTPGYISGDQLMSGLDVLVNLSDREGEGLPGVIVEAMIAGRCVVANTVAGVAEMLGDGEWGFCVDPDNLDEMERIIIRLKDDSLLRRRIGSHAAARAYALFDRKYCARQLQRIYSELSGRTNHTESSQQ